MTRVGPIILIQLILLGVELGTGYDSPGRQIALSLTNVLATAGLLWLDSRLRRKGRGLSWVSIASVIAAIWLDALGNFQAFYNQFWWYDRLTHAAGGLAVAALFTDYLLIRQQSGRLSASRSLTIWYGFFIGQFVAAMYEVSEWLGDWWFQTARVRSAFDTPRDLFFNLAGGLIVVVVFWLKKAKK